MRDGRGPPVFKIRGKVYHSIGSLMPRPGQAPKFNQIYIHQNSSEELDRRMSIFDGMRREILSHLQSTLHDINPYVRQFMDGGTTGHSRFKVPFDLDPSTPSK